ncbi:MAG: Nif3-like dinuclear metal center hexameric protein [Sulfuricurvum sp.]|uniref:Nif3-like dinuclear metal center hexameric protein n=1 Tax=Sulfuricurvum sp. TaxID=2025608 RepID=UPI002613D215|nr:Nif3-like dinuclear metal center hexameric protein [Sulfuricurvum sp.]MDD2829209.1 Nif3-like dinuclear metal center hexameric protein [Sulfuricurvum sp.]MDD4949042.1 Nif3-like dinuclear metal center hexameric protein [Sulfuricurvum sp.]
MTVREIYTFLDELSPFALQEGWDNSGLLVGDFSQEITTVVLSIDIDEALIESIPDNALLITHHPIIFGGLKQLQFNQYPAKLLAPMIRKNISNIAMHTNFDQTHLNEYVASTVLGYEVIAKEGFIAYLGVDEPFDTFALKIKRALGLSHIRSVQCHEDIRTCALVTGSGASLMRNIEAECFLTGDIKYHDAMEAKALGLSMIDIGHYESECYFGEILAGHLEKLGLSVIISPSKNPFTYH